MAVTIKKIAELAGVSVGTVDRALHDRGRVDEKVARRIKQIALELDYRPNSIAKGLSFRNKNLKISVILHIESRNAYFDDVISGIRKSKEEIADFGISVEIVKCPDFNAEAQLQLINQAIEEGSGAIAIVPINHPIIRQRLNELYKDDYPVVLLTNMIEDTDYLSFVGCDYRMAGRMAAGLLHLMYPGSGKLLLFSPSFQMRGHVMRAEGLKQQLEKMYPHIRLQSVYQLTGDDIKDYQITKKALMEFPDTSLFVFPGAFSRGNLEAIRESPLYHSAGMICYDFSEEIRAEIINGTIAAAIAKSPQQEGYTAVKILFEYLSAGKLPKFKNHYIRTYLLLRENLSEIDLAREEYAADNYKTI